jgi:hypothetical protein
MSSVEITCRNCGKKNFFKPSRANAQFCNSACQKEYNNKQFSKEAEAVGLTLIGEGKNANYRTYQFNKCGHRQEIRPSHIREYKPECNKCYENKLSNEAMEANLQMIGKGTKGDYRLYIFNKCGHQAEFGIGHVRNKNIQCEDCRQIQFKEEAEMIGLTLLGEGRTVSYRKYLVHECGHEQEFQLSHIRQGVYKCRICIEEKHKSEAKEFGLSIVGNGRSRFYRLYQFNDCDHKQEMQLSNVRYGNFLCNQCEETSRTQPSKVYLLEIQVGSFKWLKLGYAKTIKSRIYRYRLPDDAKTKRLKIIQFKTGNKAHEFESAIHHKHIRKRLPNKKMKEFHKTGFNECYPLEMLDKLLEELEYK